MKPRGDGIPGLMLETNEELTIVFEALEHAEQPLAQQLNIGYHDLIGRIHTAKLSYDDLAHRGEACDVIFKCHHPEADYILSALQHVMEAYRPIQLAEQAAIMLHNYRRSRLTIVRNN